MREMILDRTYLKGMKRACSMAMRANDSKEWDLFEAFTSGRVCALNRLLEIAAEQHESFYYPSGTATVSVEFMEQEANSEDYPCEIADEEERNWFYKGYQIIFETFLRDYRNYKAQERAAEERRKSINEKTD